MVFPHNEYHIYTTAAGIEKRHIHLTDGIIAEAERLHGLGYGPDIQGEWQNGHHLKVGVNVWLVVGNDPGVYETPSLVTYGYEGAETCRDGDFEEPLFFESMIFYKCTVREGRPSKWGPDWDVNEVREWVKSEHREAFDEALDDYLDESEKVLPSP